MKRKSIILNEKDIRILNKIKHFINTQDESIDERDVRQYTQTINWMNKIFNKQECNCNKNECCCEENKPQKMGHGKIKGLSGLTWDLSKMPADEAQYMKECIERDIEHDKIMRGLKGLLDRPYRPVRAIEQFNHKPDECQIVPHDALREIYVRDGKFIFRGKEVTILEIVRTLQHGKRVAVNNFEIFIPKPLRNAPIEEVTVAIKNQINEIIANNSDSKNGFCRCSEKINKIKDQIIITKTIKLISEILKDKFEAEGKSESWNKISKLIFEIINELNKKEG